MRKSIYIHIPFCRNICHYCDFNKFLINKQPVLNYLSSLNDEFTMYGNVAPKTIYIGGGTPSALSGEELKFLLLSIQNKFDLTGIEYTIEMNPEDLTFTKLEICKQLGVNRISIGVQTFNDQLLKNIGRKHTSSDVKEGIKRAQLLGFNNINIDLIYALPNQKIEDVYADLTEILALNIQHVSAYSLIIEPKTVFYNMYKQKKLNVPVEDKVADMMILIQNFLKNNGMLQYELSNFSFANFMSAHNLSYWNYDEYYGFGAGAHSFINGVRSINNRVVAKYITDINNGKKPILERETISLKEKMTEYVILGLRKTTGISKTSFEKHFKQTLDLVFFEEIEKGRNLGLLYYNNDALYLSSKGQMLGNEAFQLFI